MRLVVQLNCRGSWHVLQSGTIFLWLVGSCIMSLLLYLDCSRLSMGIVAWTQQGWRAASPIGLQLAWPGKIPCTPAHAGSMLGLLRHQRIPGGLPSTC